MVGKRRQLFFESEHQVGTKPKEIDLLIIKKNSSEPIDENIGRIFRKHNIVEYKSPVDYLSIDDFYKVHAYACLYKVDTDYEDEIKVEEITISFFCRRLPRKMLKHLREVRKYEIVRQEEGIYYIYGDFFPIQLVVMSELTKEKNFWLRNLTDDLQTPEELAEVAQEYQKHKDNKLYQSVMNVIVRANEERFREEKDMCEAIRELFKEEMEEKEKEITERVTQQVTQQVSRQGIAQCIRSMMKNLQMTAEQAMDVLEIPLEERKAYL